MELTILDDVNANPGPGDIDAALRASSFPEDWCLTLDDGTGEGVMIDAEYDREGMFRVSFLENRVRFHATATVDAAAASVLLKKFLARDESWRALCTWESRKQSKARLEAERADAASRARATPASPLFSILGAAIVGLFCLGAFKLVTQGPGFVADGFPKAESKLALLTGGMGLVALLFFLFALARFKAAQRWPVVSGKITLSKIEDDFATFDDNTSSGRTRRLHRPVVEFAYRVDGKDYRSRQRQLDGETSGSKTWAKGVAARYAVGSAVKVRYDPANPADAALENATGGLWIALGVSLLCLGVCVHALHAFD